MSQVVDVELLPKQREFIEATESEVGYSGAYGAGKTRALCYKAVMRATVPGAREALVRKHLVGLKATTLKTLLEQDGEMPPVLPPGTYEHNKVEKTIRIKGGGEIVYFALDDPAKIGSYNLSGVGIDEVVELKEADYLQLEGRVRLVAEGVTRQIYWCCNPGPPTHFIAKRFGLALGADPAPGCLAIQTSSLENWFLSEDYLERLERKVGVDYQRNVLGRWVGSAGLVYDSWDPQVHVVERDASEMARWFIALDDGYTNPFAALLFGMDGDGRLHGFAEVYRRGAAYQEKIREVQALMSWVANNSSQAFEFVVPDPAAAQLIREFRDAGIPCYDRVDKSVFDGIQQVHQRLRVAGDGRPRLSLSKRCKNARQEFETYEWRQKNGEYVDEPVKEHDHAMDAIRYLVRYVDRTLPGFRG